MQQECCFARNPFLKEVKTDLHLGGISKGFASLSVGCYEPNGKEVCDGSYKQGDVHVPLLDDMVLHVSPTVRGDFRVSLILENEKSEQRIVWEYLQRSRIEAIICGKVFEMGGQTLGILNVSPLKQMLSRTGQRVPITA